MHEDGEIQNYRYSTSDNADSLTRKTPEDTRRKAFPKGAGGCTVFKNTLLRLSAGDRSSLSCGGYRIPFPINAFCYSTDSI